jgi:hypothetical protein
MNSRDERLFKFILGKNSMERDERSNSIYKGGIRYSSYLSRPIFFRRTKMRYLMMGILLFCLIGCQKPDKGDTGDRGPVGQSGQPVSTKVYAGVPNSNLYQIVCPEITGSPNQLVQIYMIVNTTKIGLPFTDSTMLHYFLITGSVVGISSKGLNGTATPAVALNDPAWGQCSYRIEIYTFTTASAARAYARSMYGNDLNSMIYGK